MITKFKLYEKINIGIKDVKPKEGDYVIMTLDYIVDEGDQQQGIDIIRKCRKHIQNNIGEVSYYNDSDTVVITYKNLPMDGNVLVYIVEGGVVNPLGIVNIPISSGSLGTVPAVDALNGTGICLNGLPFNSVFKKYIPMKPNATLKVAVLAAMTANKVLFAKTTGTDYII